MLAALATALITGLAPARAEAEGPCIHDDLGRRICLEAPAERVAVLYAAFSEILAAMDSADLIAVRTAADDAAPQAQAAGTHMRPNLEILAAAAPDLAVQYGGRAEAMALAEQLEALGIPTAVFAPRTVDEVYGVIDRLGALTARNAEARALADAMRERIRAVTLRVDAALAQDGGHRPSVAFEVRSGDLICAGQGSIVTDVIRLAGGVNCVAAEERLAHLGLETLLGLDPEVYVIQQGPMNPEPAPLEERPLYQGMRALLSGRVLVVDEAAYSRPGPSLAQAVEELAAFLHPQQF